MQAPPKVRKNFIALVSESAEEHDALSRPAPRGLLAKAIFALAAVIWPRSRDAS